MKTILFFIISMISLTSVQAQTDKVFALVDGLGCPFCANGLERTFRDLKEKRQFAINLETSAMTFTMPPESKISVEDIISRVDKAGYTVTSIRIERANGQEILWPSEKEQVVEVTAEKAYTEKIIGVKGNCGMCKTRIENAVNELDGIFFVYWNQETQKLHVRYDEEIVSQEKIEQHVAAVGHDTENVRAEDHVYENLHGCCLYDRNQD
jgi:mercuric ion binding protein